MLQSKFQRSSDGAKFFDHFCTIRMVTRTAIAQHSSQWVYAPVREVLRATTTGATNSIHGHISIGNGCHCSFILFTCCYLLLLSQCCSTYTDFNSRYGTGNHSLLMKAVQYRLYGLLSVLVPLCPHSIQDALQVAVSSGVSSLLNCISQTGVMPPSFQSGYKCRRFISGIVD